MIYILYSNDYELYLGGNTVSEKDVLITPTAQLLERCSALEIPMTLFCDVACLWRYRELGMNEFPALVDNQLKDALHAGHDVQVHLHPHWAATSIEKDGPGCRYRFDTRLFLLGNHLPDDQALQQKPALDLLVRCRRYFIDLFGERFPDYRCIAFRAGGYGIQPKTEIILGALNEAGYIIDSSVVPGMVMESNVNRIDFSNVPRKGNYFLSPESGLDREASHGIFEIPVAACGGMTGSLLQASMSRFVRLLQRSIAGSVRSSGSERGYAVQSTSPGANTQKKGKLARVRRELKSMINGWQMLELCNDANLMFQLTRAYVTKRASGSGDLFLSFSCHSKSITPFMLQALGTYHRKISSYYGDELRAITFQEASRITSRPAVSTSASAIP